MIDIEQVSKNFYNIEALRSVSLRIDAGTVLGILGPNGAGKSTLFKIVAGFLNPDSGRVRPDNGIWPKIGYKPERLLLPNQLQLGQYLQTVTRLENISGQDARDEIGRVLQMTGLTGREKQRISGFSKGMRQRAAIAQALIGNAPLLLLDEPWSGLDPEGQRDMQQLIRQLRVTGRTILISTHRLHELTNVSTHLAILNKGELRYQAEVAAALSARPHVFILANRAVDPLARTFTAMHPDIKVADRTITLHNEAIPLRRRVLVTLLSAGYDIVRVEQKQQTLHDIYAEATQ